MSRSQPIAVLFVCMGDHCRSPSALAVAKRVAVDRGLEHIVLDAAGTTTNHRGELPHPLTATEGAHRGYLLNHIARPIHPDDFSQFDLIVAMETSNIDDLRRLGGGIDQRTGFYRDVEPDQLQLLRRWDPYAMPGDENLADPLGRPADAHRAMFDVIERSVPPMIDHLAWLMSETV